MQQRPTDAPTARPTATRPWLFGGLALALGAVVVMATSTLLGLDMDATEDADTAPRSTLLGAVRASAPTITADDPVPAPQGPVVLRIEDAPRANVGTELQLDIDQLDALGTYAMTVDDRQATGRTARFTGPLLRTVLEVAGIEESRTLHTRAVNDYTIDIPVSDARRFPVLLATRIDGERMDVAGYGPVRVVYPTSDYDLPPTTYDQRWIWQLTTIGHS